MYSTCASVQEAWRLLAWSPPGSPQVHGQPQLSSVTRKQTSLQGSPIQTARCRTGKRAEQAREGFRLASIPLNSHTGLWLTQSQCRVSSSPSQHPSTSHPVLSPPSILSTCTALGLTSVLPGNPGYGCKCHCCPKRQHQGQEQPPDRATHPHWGGGGGGNCFGSSAAQAHGQ